MRRTKNKNTNMLKLIRISLTITSIAIMAAGCSNPADEMTKANVEKAKSTSDNSGVQGKKYTIAEGSTIGFVGSKVTGSHDGGFKEFSGEIKVADGKIVGEPTIVIDMDSTWTDSDRLTRHLKTSDFFDVPSHPTSTFTVTAVDGTGETANVTGNLDLHGVTKSISFPAKIAVNDMEVTLQAEFAFNRRDFNINYDGKANDLIRDNVGITLNIVAKPE